MDVHLVHSVCSVYEAFWPVIFVAFRVFVAFMGHWGWTLVAFTAQVFMGLGTCLPLGNIITFKL